ncbi:MAG: hypothetical protein KJ811_01910, partial [Candidatus Margulisbacteria bacterium]|nr:hypothetical protein [Candidatus Margulisiibacteriota bacterium]
MLKNKVWVAGLLGLLVVLVISFGCGTNTSTDTSETNYTISGKVGAVSSFGLQALAATDVTHIVAISSSNNKYLATPAADGTFSLGVVAGDSYAVGFYNVSGSTITLLGYLRQNEVDWDSLPLMDAADSATDLGTIEVDTASVEAIPSINLTNLLSETNMTTATANLYGSIDDTMAMFTNVDIDGNGVFDFQETKGFMLNIIIEVTLEGTTAGSEI